jgi:hypothetical protein
LERRVGPAGYAGILQADAYGRYHKLYEVGRSLGLILQARCQADARRKFFVPANVESAARQKAGGRPAAVLSPLCLEAVQRIDRLFDIERDFNGCSAEQRRAVPQQFGASLVADLPAWISEGRRKLSGGKNVAKAMDYMLKRWAVVTRFLDDGRICLTHDAAERGLRGIALARNHGCSP